MRHTRSKTRAERKLRRWERYVDRWPYGRGILTTDGYRRAWTRWMRACNYRALNPRR